MIWFIWFHWAAGWPAKERAANSISFNSFLFENEKRKKEIGLFACGARGEATNSLPSLFLKDKKLSLIEGDGRSCCGAVELDEIEFGLPFFELRGYGRHQPHCSAKGRERNQTNSINSNSTKQRKQFTKTIQSTFWLGLLVWIDWSWKDWKWRGKERAKASGPPKGSSATNLMNGMDQLVEEWNELICGAAMGRRPGCFSSFRRNWGRQLSFSFHQTKQINSLHQFNQKRWLIDLWIGFVWLKERKRIL